MKTTIYELLGMIKDGKAPKKIMYDNEEYKITKILMENNKYYYDYINDDMDCLFPINTNILNDEVEILETTITYKPDKIEKLQYYDNSIMWCMNGREITDNEKDIIDKINEIIDKINKE